VGCFPVSPKGTPRAPIRRGASILVPSQGCFVPCGLLCSGRPALAKLRSKGIDGSVSSRSSDPDRSILKRNADEIALPPDHAALANGVKIVEAQFEIQRQRIEGVKFDSGPGICDVLNAAGEDTALRVKEQPRVFRDRRPCHISAFEFHPHHQPFTPGRAGRG
jgi:hypothetical protein